MDVFRKIPRSKVKSMKFNKLFLIFSKTCFGFKLKFNEDGHIHKASESAKNPFL